MAQGRISGRLLKDDLARSTNLTFNTNTLVVDYTNGKPGFGPNVPPVAVGPCLQAELRCSVSY